MICIRSEEPRPKILIVTSYWKESDGGGIRTYLVNLVNELVCRGEKVDVVFREGEDDNNYKISDADEARIYPVRVARAFIQLKHIRPDVIHYHGQLFYYLVAGYIYKLFYNVNLIYTFHTEPPKMDRIPAIKRYLLQLLFNKCDHITFVSRALRENVANIWGFKFKKSDITYAGVNYENVSIEEVERFRKMFGISHQSTVLLALGMTVLSYKAAGLGILIKAFRKIKSRHPNSVLIATRAGSYVRELKELAKIEGISDSVIFTGNVQNPFVALAACDIYTHISLGEGGVSISLLEAMSSGKPIIATPVGGIPEAIVDHVNGVIVEPDVDDLADGIEFILSDNEFRKMIGENAQKTAIEKFSWRQSADNILQIYYNK